MHDGAWLRSVLRKALELFEGVKVPLVRDLALSSVLDGLDVLVLLQILVQHRIGHQHLRVVRKLLLQLDVILLPPLDGVLIGYLLFESRHPLLVLSSNLPGFIHVFVVVSTDSLVSVTS